ncbi:hypothetical protein GW915_07755 [bacterium]|nr:hypothetical protein [bacterium]
MKHFGNFLFTLSFFAFTVLHVSAKDSASTGEKKDYGKDKGSCTAKKMKTIPTHVERLQSCDGEEVPSNSKLAETKFFEACEKSAEAKEHDGAAEGMAAGVHSAVESNTFSQGNVGTLEAASGEIESGAKARKEALELFNEAKAAAEAAKSEVADHEDSRDGHNYSSESLLAMILWTIDKEEEKEKGAEELAAGLAEAAAVAELGFAEEPTDETATDDAANDSESSDSDLLSWTVPEDELVEWIENPEEGASQTGEQNGAATSTDDEAVAGI